jgi:hypothetical protein
VPNKQIEDGREEDNMAGHEEKIPLLQTYITPKTPVDARLSTYFAWLAFGVFLAGIIFLAKSF